MKPKSAVPVTVISALEAKLNNFQRKKKWKIIFVKIENAEDQPKFLVWEETPFLGHPIDRVLHCRAVGRSENPGTPSTPRDNTPTL